MTKRDGTEILRGTASVGGDGSETALHRRLGELKPLADPVILADLKVGMKTTRQTVKMDFDQNMGDLYPFSLAQKLKVITEPSAYYSQELHPWGRAIIPMEMLSVLFQYRAREDKMPIRGPAVGLFADQEIRLLRGPLFPGETYTTEREIVALSGSRRTESAWIRTTVFAADDKPVATMLLNMASLKDLLRRLRAGAQSALRINQATPLSPTRTTTKWPACPISKPTRSPPNTATCSSATRTCTSCW